MNRMNRILLCGLLLCPLGAGERFYGQESRKFMSEPIISATEDSTYSYSIITDGDPLDSPVLSGSSLPAWLTLVDNGDGTGTLSGTPQPGNVADHVIRLDVSIKAGVTQIYSTSSAFAAVKDDGSVVTWGNSSDGGDSSTVSDDLSSGVTQIYSTERAFAALKVDGSVVTWGRAGQGGDSSAVTGNLGSGVTQIHSTERAFAVLKIDGSVVTWGDSRYGGNSSAETGDLVSGVTQIYSNHYAFAALKGDGSVITWGYPTFGGDSSTVSDDLISGITQIYSTEMAVAAVKDDGSVVTWGHPSEGGNSGAVANYFCTFAVQDSQEFVITVAPVNPIDLVNVGYVSEPFGFDFESQMGSRYVVEATGDLKKWGVVKTYNGTGTLIRFEEERDQVFPQIYYRVKVVE